MAIQKFSLVSVQKIRQFIQNALVEPDRSQQTQRWAQAAEVPEPTSLDDLSSLFSLGGAASAKPIAPSARWELGVVNPASAFLNLPGLFLKRDFRLVGYVYQSPAGRRGVVLGVPEALSTTAQLEAALHTGGTADQPPQLPNALPNVMQAIDGDRSSASFLIASLLLRELRDYGASGKHQHWSHHRMIETIPPQAQWKWNTPPPIDLAPKVKVLADGQAAVEFFSCRVSTPVAIVRHLDRYPADSYVPVSVDRPIAVPQR